MAKMKVLVLFGGTTNDYEQSLRSATAVLQALPEEQYEPVAVGISRKGRWLYFPGDICEIEAGTWEQNPDCSPAILSPDPAHRGILILEDDTYSLKRVDIIFSLLHGAYGEDGSVQGLCELSHIPYIGNGILGSAVCRNKAMAHEILSAAGIHTPQWYSISQRDLNRIDARCEEAEEKLGYPLFIKPASCDASKGTSVVNNFEELTTAVKLAFTQDSTVLIEQLVKGKELRVAVFGYDMPFSSFIGEMKFGKLVIPAAIEDALVPTLREIAIQAYTALDCKELALFDFFYTDNGEILLGEVNTMPSLAEDAIYPQLMNDLGMRYTYLLEKLIEQALEHADRGF